MPQVTDKPSAPTYWRSLNELENTPEFREMLKKEFPGIQASDYSEPSRRRFIQLMGASMALATATGCWKEDKIVPGVKGDSSVIPGTPKHYATALEIGGVSQALLVTSYDGRPVKIEGNPAHPDSLGATSLFAQATTLELYDPDRSTQILRKAERGTTPVAANEFSAFIKDHFGALKAKQGAGLRVLSDATSSVTMAGLKAKFAAAFPQAQWHEYEPLSRDSEREATKLAFGQALRPIPSLKDAKIILSLDSDFLGDHPAALRLSREFAANRKAGAGMSRYYAVESAFSSTASNSDHRLPMPSTDIGAFLAAVALELAKDAKLSASPAAKVLSGLKSEGDWDDATKKFLGALVKDLTANAGSSIVLVGPRQPADVQALGFAINALLGNIGKTLSFISDLEPARVSHAESITALSASIDKGEVATLVILGGNPAFDAPADLKFAEKLTKVQTVIHQSLYFNETSALAVWHLPRAHFLEAWGDTRGWDGTQSVQQPLIMPLYNSKSSLEFVSEILGEPKKGLDLVKAALKDATKDDAGWRKAVHDGVVAGSVAAAAKAELKTDALKVDLKRLPKGSVEIVFTPDTKVLDGRFANNGWLQEVPDFMTKLTWDNALLVAPETATRLNLAHEQVVTVTLGGRKLDAAVYTMPGQAKDSIAIALGYGRTVSGNVGGNLEKRIASPGFNAYALRSSTAMNIDASGATFAPTGKTYQLATTQDHWAIDATGKDGIEKRLPDLIREETATVYEKNKDHKDHFRHKVHYPGNEQQLYKEWEYDGNKWGMAVDLNTCTGCVACVVACQSENNIPIVGKEQVLKGRDMHWLRMDRYFKGDVANPQIAQQPIMCQHCENAPCEQVCPVAATVHSSEGLNDMAYNRCIGTRYCANNCPFKVRRFNYFDWNKTVRKSESDVPKMVFNPEVTVRMRGVMEKCTFCVQRIQTVKIKQKNAGERNEKNRALVKDGEIKTACQQVCPTDAIVFGDLNDKDSRIAKLHAEARAYEILAELNIRPRVTYLGKIRNPHPDLAEVVKNEHAGHGHGH